MAKIYFHRVPEFWRKEDKLRFLSEKQSIANIEWQELIPDEKHNWITEGLQAEFAEFIPLGTKEGKAAKGESEGVIFKIYSNGVKTNRDVWAYNFNQQALAVNMQKTIEIYNDYVSRWSRNQDKQISIDDFVQYDDTQLSWGESLKANLKRGKFAEFKAEKIRNSLYRPFTKSSLFFDRIFNERVYVFPSIFPTPENENRVICVSDKGYRAAYSVLMTNLIPELHLCASIDAIQCFPYYIYAEDGSQRQENITNWALNHFQQYYQDINITKRDIFHYVYGLLHHPHYREKYAANLKRELPRIPLINNFWEFSRAGQQLAELHLNYEQQREYPLQKIVTPGAKLHYRVEKMRLTKEKDAIIYNESLTLKGIPPKTFNYRLGNRSALEWVIDQYQAKIDGQSGSRDGLEWFHEFQAKTQKSSGILNDPNRLDDEKYILRLLGQVITVSLETVKIVENLSKSVDYSSSTL